jgi:hypothetical protein
MRLPRYRLRTAMVLMGATALVLALGLRSSRLHERSSFHRDRASWFHLLSIPNRCATGDFQEGLLKVVKVPDGSLEVRPASPGAELILQRRETKRSE